MAELAWSSLRGKVAVGVVVGVLVEVLACVCVRGRVPGSQWTLSQVTDSREVLLSRARPAAW
eukprot:228907-Chlamydomonas_euryale.AAC.2